MEELWIPIVAMVAPAAVIGLMFWLRYRSQSDLQQTIRLALEKGHEISPEVIDRLGHPKAPKNKDLRLGLVWMGLAGGLALCGLMSSYWAIDALYGCLAAAAFPFAIGSAYLLMWKFASND